MSQPRRVFVGGLDIRSMPAPAHLEREGEGGAGRGAHALAAHRRRDSSNGQHCNYIRSRPWVSKCKRAPGDFAQGLKLCGKEISDRWSGKKKWMKCLLSLLRGRKQPATSKHLRGLHRISYLDCVSTVQLMLWDPRGRCLSCCTMYIVRAGCQYVLPTLSPRAWKPTYLLHT